MFKKDERGADMGFDGIKERCVSLCAAAFGERLEAIYLTGSLYYGDAVPGVSDLDSFAVLREERPGDATQAERVERELERLFPELNGAHVGMLTEKRLASDPFCRFMLRYNSELLSGRDAAGEMDARLGGLKPDGRTARLRLPFARRCLADALAGRRPECTGEIPRDPAYAARKLARYFVVVEGAYFLMSRGKFTTFRKEDVLAGLGRECPEFGPELDLARTALAGRAGENCGALTQRIYLLTKYMLDQEERGS